MRSNHTLTHAYDMAAHRWRASIEGLGYAAAYRWLIGQTGLQTRDVSVLDAGCGTGDFTRALVEVAGPPKSTMLLDPSGQMVDSAMRSLTHSTPRLRALTSTLQDARATPHDIVLCAHVIEHFADTAQALQLLKAQMAPGGRLLLVVSNGMIWSA